MQLKLCGAAIVSDAQAEPCTPGIVPVDVATVLLRPKVQLPYGPLCHSAAGTAAVPALHTLHYHSGTAETVAGHRLQRKLFQHFCRS